MIEFSPLNCLEHYRNQSPTQKFRGNIQKSRSPEKYKDRKCFEEFCAIKQIIFRYNEVPSVDRFSSLRWNPKRMKTDSSAKANSLSYRRWIDTYNLSPETVSHPRPKIPPEIKKILRGFPLPFKQALFLAPMSSVSQRHRKSSGSGTEKKHKRPKKGEIY